jgi:hypothetical protein
MLVAHPGLNTLVLEFKITEGLRATANARQSLLFMQSRLELLKMLKVKEWAQFTADFDEFSPHAPATSASETGGDFCRFLVDLQIKVLANAGVDVSRPKPGSNGQRTFR